MKARHLRMQARSRRLMRQVWCKGSPARLHRFRPLPRYSRFPGAEVRPFVGQGRDRRLEAWSNGLEKAPQALIGLRAGRIAANVSSRSIETVVHGKSRSPARR